MPNRALGVGCSSVFLVPQTACPSASPRHLLSAHLGPLSGPRCVVWCTPATGFPAALGSFQPAPCGLLTPSRVEFAPWAMTGRAVSSWTFCASVRSCRISFPCTLQSRLKLGPCRALPRPPSEGSCPSVGARVSHDLAFSLALLSRRPERGAGAGRRGVKAGGEQVPREGRRPVSPVPPVHGGRGFAS